MDDHNHSHDHDHHSHDHDQHNHSHDNGHQKKFGCSETVRLSIMLTMITLFFFLEITAGRITNSITLVTDSFHMLSDVIALFIALISSRIAKKKSSKNTFGWIRAEILGALVNSVFLLALCVSIFIEAIERFIQTETIREVNLLLYVACTGLTINTLGLFIFGHGHGHSHGHDHSHGDSHIEDSSSESSPITSSNIKSYLTDHVGINSSIENGLSRSLINDSIDNLYIHEQKSCFSCCKMNHSNLNIRAVFLHVLADAFGSVVVITSALLNKYQEQLNIGSDIIHYVDPVLCLILVAIILTTTIPLLKEAALILLQTVPNEVKINHVKEDLLKIKGILSIHELHIWKLSGTKIIATAHLTCHNLQEYMAIHSHVKQLFHNRGIHSTTIQAEFIDPIKDVKNDCILECVNDCHEDTCCGQTKRRNSLRQRNHSHHDEIINTV